MCITTPVLSSTATHTPFDDTQKTNNVDKTENSISLRVWVVAFPKIFLHGKFVLFSVMFPMFLVDGQIDYDFDDGTYSTGTNFQKHKFSESGIYLVKVEFNTIFGIKVIGSTRAIII